MVLKIEIVFQKMKKILDSHSRALHDMKQGDFRRAIGDLHFVIENAQEATYILNELIEEREENDCSIPDENFYERLQ
ncbi:hypothetical protein BSONL12_23285 [Bacillus sonorensis L12]|uniref:Uncharacterized protein n=2 Tax=Bacillus TaxID=1386 RepID=M5NYM3_9BACI|nr:hypothetical protein BSONL12_23285 [Bacillus sonorensis L12]